MPPYLEPGRPFAGPVVYIGDGDSLCVGVGQGPGAWVEIRLADYYAPELADAGGIEAKATLARIAKGKRVECVAQHRSYDRVVAVCRLQGVSLGDRMRAAGMGEGGRGRGAETCLTTRPVLSPAPRPPPSGQRPPAGRASGR